MARDFAHKLYTSKAWGELRRNLIIERGPVCQECGSLIADSSKLVGHHTIMLSPDNINDPNVALNPAFIRLLCTWCHNAEPGHFLDQNTHSVFIVYGSPMSGKTTLVNQLARYGDMILDIDKIYEAISGMPLYDKPENLRFNVFRIRDLMIDMVKTRFGKWRDAYVVTGGAIKAERERLAKELGGELIYVESTKEECMSRVANSGKSKDWYKYIDKWWSEYTP